MADACACTLLNLPGELRNTIYHLVLVKDKPVIVPAREVSGTSKNRPRATHKWMFNCCLPALTNTCRQLRRETISIFFMLNTIHFVAPIYSRGGYAIPRRQHLSIGNVAPYLSRLEIFHAGTLVMYTTVDIYECKLKFMYQGSHSDRAARIPDRGRNLGTVKSTLEKVIQKHGGKISLTQGEVQRIVRSLL